MKRHEAVHERNWAGAVGLPLTRFRKTVALAEQPTPMRRAVAASIAGGLAFMIVQIVFGLALGLGWTAIWLSSVALAIAAAYAAVTLRRGLAIVYGILGMLWLLLEIVGGILSLAASSI